MSYLEKLEHIKAIVLDLDGVLTDGGVYVSETGAQLRKMNIKDGYAIQLAVKMQYTVAVISGSHADSVFSRLQGLGIQEIHLGVKNKVECLEGILQRRNLNFSQVAYMGDDVPDLQVMKRVGVAACPADACTEILQLSSFISKKKGGEACVRDLIETIMRAQSTWDNQWSTLTRSI
jgi:3-deoxy-D-manno-octulosonate 8-phosphate phosphatase (KDO 8-P phosphatase)